MHHKDGCAGSQVGDGAGGGEEKLHTAGQMHAHQIQGDRAGVLEFEVFELLRIHAVRRTGHGRVVHNLGDAQVLLRQAGSGRVIRGLDDAAPIVHQLNRLAAGRELALVRPLNIESHAAARSGRPRAEGDDIRRDIKHAGRGHHHAEAEGVVDSARKPPAGEVNRIWIGVGELDVLVCLVVRGRVEFDRADLHHRVGRAAARCSSPG